jgi:phosphatidylglycerol:prolipoprotein diacylglycerol transferase
MGLFNIRTQCWECYHPTFLYESVWNAAGFVLLHCLSSRRKYDGQIALGYAAWYGLGRAFIEGLRMDSLYLGSFRVSQLLAAVSCLAAVAVLLWQHFRGRDGKELYVNRMRST